MNATILALDASSTSIGYVVFAGDAVLAHGEQRLAQHDINDRCLRAELTISELLTRHAAVDVVAIESPVARYAKAVIPQALVSGAIRAAVRRSGRHVVDVTPAEAKQALTGRGNSDKLVMQAAATAYGVHGEHAADAVGVALAAVGKVRVEL